MVAENIGGKKIAEGNEWSLIVNLLSSQKIAQAIEYLPEHTAERQRIGRNGRRAVLREYNWGTEARKLAEFYRLLLT